ncbi:rod shape-determining protein [Marivirga tractuosa]|uniref:Cell shape-determining protein MreB n=1 Tax=Marivirga tractuosa (strain ATCC 23168 / DSM 4126 / NBRC 15989 / NCIMB 1408 / VKM B-1430 / H-43) TaxID=643867 RepID=E4TR16_MARTH|nr:MULTISPECIES: rod shape-determining protein [Marivirga]ADR22697.1 cell shape determining protein MreB/Mrl [Marivirga tractuosa DSM 4126]WKV12970.1 rod shape-determining protein [Marivirga harenae]BDD16632.1 rod shape-determining protein [Marivirga tractuosa]
MANKRDITIDLGNNNTVLTGMINTLFSESTVVALNSKKNSYLLAGKAALEMEGKINGDTKVVRPLKNGVIADLNATTKMLNAFVKTLYPSRSILGFHNIIASVPYGTTEVERRALRLALDQFNSRSTKLIFEPVAAALGMGLNIKEPDGKMIIDIGGGLTEISLISLSGVVTYMALKVGGDTFNSDIRNYIEKKYIISISEKSAEKIKLQIGAATENSIPLNEDCTVVGKDNLTGIPKQISLNYKEIAMILNNTLTKIEDSVIKTLEQCPPELAGDIYTNGVYLTGGGALLKGLKERLESSIQLKVHLSDQSLLSVSKGMEIVLSQMDKHKALIFK